MDRIASRKDTLLSTAESSSELFTVMTAGTTRSSRHSKLGRNLFLGLRLPLRRFDEPRADLRSNDERTRCCQRLRVMAHCLPLKVATALGPYKGDKRNSV